MAPAIRNLQKEDIHNGFLDTLDSLSPVSDIAMDRADAIFEDITSNPDHLIIVAEQQGRIVATITLLIEQKFIHSGGLAGHIEDVAVHKSNQGRGIGAMMVRYALDLSKQRGCYKTILDCSEEVKPFYEGLGFRQQGNSMRFDHG